MTKSDTRMLEGRVAIVTGSSRGIGEAIVKEFAHQGAAVVVHGRNESAVASVVAAIRDDGGEAMSVTGDVTDFGQIEAMRHQVEETLGVEILSNAGGASPAPLEEIPIEGWRATVGGNLRHVPAAALPLVWCDPRQHHHRRVVGGPPRRRYLPPLLTGRPKLPLPS